MLCRDVTGNVMYIHPIIYKRSENKCIPHLHKKIVIQNHHDKNHELLIHNGGLWWRDRPPWFLHLALKLGQNQWIFDSHNKRFLTLIHKVLVIYIMFGVWCAMTGTSFTGPIYFCSETINSQCYNIILTSFEL